MARAALGPRETIAAAADSLVAVANAGSGCVIAHGAAGGSSAVLTAAHLFTRKRKTSVRIRLGRHFRDYDAVVVRIDRENDMALLETIDELPTRAIPIATREPVLYEHVLALGCPARTWRDRAPQWFGTVVDCRITGVEGSNDGEDCGDYQLSIPVGAGMSGGPLINRSGQLVGMVYAGDDRAFVSFAVRLAVVRAFVQKHIG